MVTSFRSRNCRPCLVVKPRNRNGGERGTQSNLTDIFRVGLGSLARHVPSAQRLCPLVQLRLPGKLFGGLGVHICADSGA